MIYLIDDKQKRQQQLGWIPERFEKFSNHISPLYTIAEVAAQGDMLYEEGNTILYHESFLDPSYDGNFSIEQREKLKNIASKNHLNVAFFSGSQNFRSQSDNIAYLPVATLYQNLELYISLAQTHQADLKYLLFGSNASAEEGLLEQLNEYNKNIELREVTIPGNNLFLKPNVRVMDHRMEGIHEQELFKVDDEYLSAKVLAWLTDSEYDRIILPLCFGETLSDYNGLRLATHIRCTPTPNQNKSILIYSFVEIGELLQHEYFNILKTRDVELVHYSSSAILAAANKPVSRLSLSTISSEMAKLKLDPPMNFDDEHSIANTWAIHQWAKRLGCDQTAELREIFKQVESNLYFKYLRTVHTAQDAELINPNELKLTYRGDCRVLLIDDDAEKGWWEIVAFILDDNNSIYVDQLWSNFRYNTVEKIMADAIERIQNDDIGVVLLDFRLHPSDLLKSNVSDISGVRLLRQIKEYNPGIQVIVFSATSKAENLQALHIAEADAFVSKHPREKNTNVSELLEALEISLSKACWLKPMWTKTESCIEHLNAVSRKTRDGAIYDKAFTGGIISFLRLGFDSVSQTHTKNVFDSAFMYYFLVLEALSKELVDEDQPQETIQTNDDGTRIKIYQFTWRRNFEFLKHYDRQSRQLTKRNLESKSRRIPYEPKFVNLIERAQIKDVDSAELVELRNSFNHPDLTKHRKAAAVKKEHVEDLFSICYGLIMSL